MPPLYQYECPKCGHSEDLHRPIAERDTGAPRCPNRRHGTMTRVQSATLGRVINPAVPRRGRGMNY